MVQGMYGGQCMYERALTGLDSTRRVQSTGFVISEGTPKTTNPAAVTSGPGKRRKVSNQSQKPPESSQNSGNGSIETPTANGKGYKDNNEDENDMAISENEGSSNSVPPQEPVVELPPAFRGSSGEEEDNESQKLSGPKQATPLPSSLENSPEPRPSVKRLTLPSRTPQAMRSATRLTANGPKLTPSFSNSADTPTRTAVLRDPKKSLSPAKSAATPPKSAEKQGAARSSPRLQAKPRVSYSENNSTDIPASEHTPPSSLGPLRRGERSEITPRAAGSGIRSSKNGAIAVQESDSDDTLGPGGSGSQSNRKTAELPTMQEDDSEITPKPSRSGARSGVTPKVRGKTTPQMSKIPEDDAEITPQPSTSKDKYKKLKDTSVISSKSSMSKARSKNLGTVDNDSEIISKPSAKSKQAAVEDAEITPRPKKSRTQDNMGPKPTPKSRIRSNKSQTHDEVRSSPRLRSKSKVSYNEESLGEGAQQTSINSMTPVKDNPPAKAQEEFEPEPELEPENEWGPEPEPEPEVQEMPSKKSRPATKPADKQHSKTDTSITLNLQKVPVNAGGTKRVNAIDVVSQIVLEILSSAEDGIEAPWAINAFTQYSDLVDQRFCRLVDAIDVNNTLSKAVKRAETKRNNLRLELLQLRKQRTELALEMQRVRDDHQTDKTNINRLREISSFVDDLRGLKETANDSSNTEPTESLMTDIVKLDPIINTHYGALERIKALSKRLNDIDEALG